MASSNRQKKPKPATQLTVPDLGPVEQIPVGLLKPYTRNARTHNDRQIALIAQSIETFGFTNPIITEEDGTIIAGHGRWEAAKQLGLENVPILRSRHLTPERVQAYRLADNKLAELAGWDSEMLRIELGALSTIDLDFNIETIGFEQAEIDLMLDSPSTTHEAPANDPADQDIPEPPLSPVSRTGDLWLLDKHRLLVGSSLMSASFDMLMDGKKAQMVFQDSPYNVPINGHVSGLGKVRHREFAMASGEMSPGQFQNFLRTNLALVTSHLVNGAVLDLCMDWRGAFALQSAMMEAGLELINLAAWVKTNAGMGSLYRSQHELVFIAKHGKAGHINNVQLGRFKRHRTNVWRYAGVNTFGRDRAAQLGAHPTPKPVPLVADAIRDVTHRGHIVLDSFMGSGATLIAAERTGRIGYGIDIDPAYIDVCIARWQALTDKQARLAGSGQTFAEIAQERRPESPLDNKTRA